MFNTIWDCHQIIREQLVDHIPGELPGLGVELDEALAARYPYRAAYLPVARLTDGTMHDW